MYTGSDPLGPSGGDSEESTPQNPFIDKAEKRTLEKPPEEQSSDDHTSSPPPESSTEKGPVQSLQDKVREASEIVQDQAERQKPGEPTREGYAAQIMEHEDFVDFLSSYRVRRFDIGLTVSQLFSLQIAEGENPLLLEPDEEDREVISALTMPRKRRFYRKQYAFSSGTTITFVTPTGRSHRNSFEVIRQLRHDWDIKEPDEEQAPSEVRGQPLRRGPEEESMSMEQALTQRYVLDVVAIAQHLEMFGGELVGSAGADEKAFSSVQELRRRVAWLIDQPQFLFDQIGELYNSFANTVRVALSRSVRNFS